MERCDRCKTIIAEPSEYDELKCKDSCLSHLGDAVTLCCACGEGAFAVMTKYLDDGCPADWRCGCKQRRETIAHYEAQILERPEATPRLRYWREMVVKQTERIAKCQHPDHAKSLV